MYLWSKLSSIKWNDVWEERFYGNVNAVIEEIKGGKSIRLQVYCETEKDAQKISAQFGGSIREVKKAKWEAPQDLTQKPLLIRNRLVLSQAVKPEQINALSEQYPERTIINIPAEMAFGTGDHPTTATCLRHVVDFSETQSGSWSMVDVGCGTSVIAIAAYHLGASPVKAFDFDEKAAEVSEKNVILNNAAPIKVDTLDVFDWKPERAYDFVAANLFSTILQKAFPILKVALKPQGTIVISGILAEQWEKTKCVAEEAGFVFKDVKKVGKWVTARGGHAG